MKKKLALVGSGIKSISHLTVEVKAHINNADAVLYLVNEPVIEEWVKRESRCCDSLENAYFSSTLRNISYENVTRRILDVLRDKNNVCVVFYGHPTVYASPGLTAVQEAEKMGVEVTILPSISVEDCLFADLKIDPGSCGCYSVEATDFIVYERKFDPTSHLILWQVGVIGRTDNIECQPLSIGLKLLQERLVQFYSKTHELYLYEASLYPGIDCKLSKFKIDDLTEQNFSTISTLYVPPIQASNVNLSIMNKLGMERDAALLHQ